MRGVRVVVLVVVVIGWLVAVGSLVTSVADLSSLPGFWQNVLGLWPDAGTPESWVVRLAAIGVVIAGIVVFRVLGKTLARRDSARDAAARGISVAR